MYILFEATSTYGEKRFGDYDIMGVTASEREAIDWKLKNLSCRDYKYCSNRFFDELVIKRN